MWPRHPIFTDLLERKGYVSLPNCLKLYEIKPGGFAWLIYFPFREQRWRFLFTIIVLKITTNSKFSERLKFPRFWRTNSKNNNFITALKTEENIATSGQIIGSAWHQNRFGFFCYSLYRLSVVHAAICRIVQKKTVRNSHLSTFL